MNTPALRLQGKNVFVYLFGAALCIVTWALTEYSLSLSLLPHKIILEALYGFSFVFIEGTGYAQTDGLFLIAKSCLGIRLFISLFGIVLFGFSHRFKTKRILKLLGFYALLLPVSFAVTMTRIALSLPFCGGESFTLIHNVISLVIYFAAGFALYAVTDKKLPDNTNSCLKSSSRSPANPAAAGFSDSGKGRF